jgi:hypothetical protein
LYVTLRREVVYLVRLSFLNDSNEVGGIREITVMHREPGVNVLRLGINSVHPLGIELGRPALDAVYHVSFREEQSGEVCAVLPRYTGDKRSFHLIGLGVWPTAVNRLLGAGRATSMIIER